MGVVIQMNRSVDLEIMCTTAYCKTNINLECNGIEHEVA